MVPAGRTEAVVTPGRTDGNTLHRRVRRYGMWGVSCLCSAVLFLGGCIVTKDKYEAAVADLETARMELEKSRMQYETLERENDELRAENEKAVLDLGTLSAEIQQIKEDQQGERDLLATREAQLQRDREALAGILRDVQLVYQKLKSRNRALRETVRRYQKKLEAVRKVKVKRRPPDTVKPKEHAHAKQPSPKPVPPPVAVPFNGTATPINVNIASANDLVLFLGLTKDVADKVVSNRPYRVRGELVSKQVVPQATFDVIKDRITAAPQ